MKYEFWESSMPNIKKISPNYSSIKKLNTLELIKIYFYLVDNNKKNIMITTKNILEERRSVPLIHISDETFNEKCFQQV